MIAIYDAAIIGGSHAGLSAALILGRARRKVVVIDSTHCGVATNYGNGKELTGQ